MELYEVERPYGEKVIMEWDLKHIQKENLHRC